MKKVIAILVSAMLVVSLASFTDNSIFQYLIYSMTDEEHFLEEYQGKEIMIVVLPSSKNSADSLFIESIGSLTASHLDSLAVIGIPSYEFGYTDEARDSLLQWYSAVMGDHILFSVGMYMSGEKPELQNPLFAWLTNEEQNQHFSKPVVGDCQSFFISREGVLHAVSMPGGIIDEDFLQRVFRGVISE